MSKQLTTFNNGRVAETIEVTDFQYSQVRQLLRERPLMEVLDELENGSYAAKREFNSTLGNMEARHGAAIRAAETKVNNLRFELQQADTALRAAATAGKYSEAPTIEARKVELNQAILSAQLDLAQVRANSAGERARFLAGEAKGSQGSVASINGIPWDVVRKIATAILWEFASKTMGADVAGLANQQADHAAYQAMAAREEVEQAKKALADYQVAAQSRYSGQQVTNKAEVRTPEPTGPNWGPPWYK